MLDWHLCKICYPLEIKLLLLIILLYDAGHMAKMAAMPIYGKIP